MKHLSRDEIKEGLKKYHSNLGDRNFDISIDEYDEKKNAEVVSQGLHSTGYKSPTIRYSIIFKEGGENKKFTKTLFVKSYGEGKISNFFENPPTNIYSSRMEQSCLKEFGYFARLNKLVPDEKRLFPEYYWQESGKDTLKIFMEHLSGGIIGKDFRSITNEENRVLTELAIKQPQSKQDLDKKCDIESIEKLEELGFVARNGKNYMTTPKFSERFEYNSKENKLFIKKDYEDKKLKVIHSGLESIFELHDLLIDAFKPRVAAKMGLMRSKSSSDAYTKKFKDKLQKYHAFLNKKKDEDKLEDIGKCFKEKIAKIFENSSQSFGHGSCHALHMIYQTKEKETKVKFIDLYHLSYMPWTFDFVEYTDFLKLFCGISDDIYNGLWHKAFSRRIDNKNKGEDDASREELKSLTMLDKTVNALGSLGNILKNPKKFLKGDIQDTQYRLDKYASQLTFILKNHSSINGNLRDKIAEYIIK